ncbi:MAG: flagella basal body P-ring formation protein FlgA [Acidobacteria bacterium]|nr:flagella basal body P-ring formation protein FlgA [Acidobacteriota bacterium]
MRITSLPSRLLLLAAGLLAASAVAALPLHSSCRATPEEALKPSSTHTDEPAQGFRVANIRWDPYLQQQWAIVVSCTHPELPPLALKVPNRYASVIKLSPPAVRNGDVVRAWSQDPFVRIEVTGVAEGSAAIGDRIRIRTIRSLSSSDGLVVSDSSETLFGIVRGPHNVEIEP